MLHFSGRGILLDIEGTTSAVSYVYEVMFPYARSGLDAYLASHWDDAATAAACEQMARDVGCDSLSQDEMRDEAIRLMEGDVKATGLKQLQGLIWEAGFKSGELRAHVFPDVSPALAAWREAGVDLRIYSSGSVHAQKLFFAHSQCGDLLPYISAHYDTTTGPKREAQSYQRIADDWTLGNQPAQAAEILFLSDVVAELDAAQSAGMQTALVAREGNAPVEPGHAHPAITSFDQIVLGEPRS